MLNHMHPSSTFALYEVVLSSTGTEELCLLFANKGYANVVSMDSQESDIIGKMFTEILPGVIAWQSMFIDVALRRRETSSFESYSQASNTHVHAQMFSPEYGKVVFISHVRDQFVKSEAEKESEEQRIRMMMQMLPEGVCYASAVYDEESGNLIDIFCIIVNETFEVYESVRVGSLQGNYFYKLYPAESKMCLIKVDQALKNNEKIVYTQQNSKRQIIEVSVYPQAENQIFIFERDVTARIATEEAKTLFISNMSHEMRTPLSGIIGLTELALDDVSDPVKQVDYLLKIKNNAKSLLTIVNDVLDFTKLDTGKMNLEKTPFCIYTLINECKTITQYDAESKGISLYVHSEWEPGLLLIGDPARLKQALLNLLSNAVKFTKKGYVSFSLKCNAIVRSEKKYAVTLGFEIKDTGIGIMPEKLNVIFEPFIQGHEGITRRFGGTGLGLPITKNIIELMGGRLKIRSVPGSGSTFFFNLEFDISTEIRMIDAISVKPPMFDATILICEDNEINTQVIKENLEKMGISVVTAENGKLGVDMVYDQPQRFDIIFMDIQMPIMDGVSAAKKIKDSGCKAPIIALTANITQNERHKYLTAGMSDCLSKPINRQKLWKCLQTYLTPIGYKTIDVLTKQKQSGQQEPIGNAVNWGMGLENCAGNQDFYENMLKIFMGKSKDTFNHIKNAVHEKNYTLLHRLCHHEITTTTLIGAERLAEILTFLSDKAKENSPNFQDEEFSHKALSAYQTELLRVLDGIVKYLT